MWEIISCHLEQKGHSETWFMEDPINSGKPLKVFE